MDLRHIEQIVAICKAGSFSGAAQALGISQPTISKSISKLEMKLGIKLFERTNTHARPTVYGRFVADRGSPVLRTATTLGHELEQMARGEAGQLRIGVGPATRLRPAPRVVQRTTEAFPRLQVTTRYAGPRMMMRALRSGGYDLVFCHRETAIAEDDLIRVKIFEDKYIVVARPDHPAVDQAPLSAEEFLSFPLASAGLTPDFQMWLGELSDVQKLNSEAFVSDDYDLIKHVPFHYGHVARGPRFIFENELKQGALVELPLTSEFQYECWMLTTASSWASPIVKAVAKFAKESL